MALIDNLVSYWKLDESSGNAADAHGSNTLTNTGSATFVSGILNNGADLELSSTQYFLISDGSQVGLDLTGDMGISGWYKPESIVSGAFTVNSLVSKWSSTGNQRAYWFGVGRDGSNVISLLFLHSGDGSSSTINAVNFAFSTATWYHVGMSYDASAGQVDFYVNGSSIGSVTGLATSTFNSSQQFELGATSQQSQWADGVMDEWGIWSRTLDSSDMAALYNSGTPPAYPFSIASTFIPRTTFL